MGAGDRRDVPPLGVLQLTLDQLAARLDNLRPTITNIIGFHGLIDAEAAKTPLDGMCYQVHFTASSLHLARQIIQIVNELQADDFP